jgi:hypothetical protein
MVNKGAPLTVLGNEKLKTEEPEKTLPPEKCLKKVHHLLKKSWIRP